jgi:hypothetical protein
VQQPAAVNTLFSQVLRVDHSFQYPAGALAGQGPPAGAPPGQTAWYGADAQVNPGAPLRYRHVFSVGGSVYLSADDDDSNSANLSPVNRWVGFIIFRSGTNSFSSAFLTLSGASSDSVNFGVVYQLGVFAIVNGESQTLSSVYSSGRPQWVVARLDFAEGTESLFVNPKAGAEPKIPDAQPRMTSDFQAAGFNQITLDVFGNENFWFFDEVRIGTTFKNLLNGN